MPVTRDSMAWGVVGQGPPVTGGEPVDRGGADHVRQHVGKQVPGHGLPVALRVGGGFAGRHDGGDLVGDVLAGGLDVPGRVPGVGRIGEVGVVRPEDRPHHRVTGPVDLPPAAGVGGQLGRAPDAEPDAGPQQRVLVEGSRARSIRRRCRLGVWCATKLATDAGGWRQVNRAGHPMMWPIFWSDDTHFTNPANTRHPTAGCRQRQRQPGRRRRDGQRNLRRPAGLRGDRGPGPVPTCCRT